MPTLEWEVALFSRRKSVSKDPSFISGHSSWYERSGNIQCGMKRFQASYV